jgi:hypothetical protein
MMKVVNDTLLRVAKIIVIFTIDVVGLIFNF